MANKYIAWDPTNGRNKEIEATTTSAGVGDAGEIIALDATGKIDVTLLPPGIGEAVYVAPAFENLTAGQFINLFDNAGTTNARLADASNGRKADGFVLDNVVAPADATIHYGDVNNQLTGLTEAAEYWLSNTVPGGVMTPAPAVAGHIVQRLGKALTATELVIDIQEVPLELA